MKSDLILSHNLGTTGNLAVLYDSNGTILKSWFSGYQTEYRHGNKVEQDANDWWNAVCESTLGVLRGINERSINSVCFSGQMMGCLCIDKDGYPLANSIIWADMRAEKEAAKLNDDIDETKFYHITGHRISPSYSLAKLMWIKRNNPEIYKRTSKVIQAKDYIVYKLTGKILTDYSDASGTNMFDLGNFEWSDTILSIAGINRELLPEAVASTTVAGEVTIEAAAETGLLPGTPVVIGAGDGLCSNISSGCTEADEAFMYFGSSAWIGLTKDEPYYDSELRTFNWAHVQKGKSMPCGTMQAAGNTVNWLNKEIARIESIQAERQQVHINNLIDQEIQNSNPGANGMLFLPYLSGERSPHWNPDAAGVILGLKMDHTRSDFFRASIEGIALNLKLIWDSLGEQISCRELVLVGGLSLSPVKKQILSDVLDVIVVNNNHSRDSKPFGAAVIGGLGTGIFYNLQDAGRIIKKIDPVHPDPARVALYKKLLPVFKEGYENLKPTFKNLSYLDGGK